MIATPAAAHVARLHRYMTERELTEWEEAAVASLALLGMDLLTGPRAAVQERLRNTLRLMEPGD